MSRTGKVFSLLLVVALIMSLFAMGGCATEQPAEEPAGEATTTPAAEIKLIEPGKLLVGSDTAFPPFESMNGDVAEGFDVDLMNAIGEKLGLKVEFKTRYSTR